MEFIFFIIKCYLLVAVFLSQEFSGHFETCLHTYMHAHTHTHTHTHRHTHTHTHTYNFTHLFVVAISVPTHTVIKYLSEITVNRVPDYVIVFTRTVFLKHYFLFCTVTDEGLRPKRIMKFLLFTYFRQSCPSSTFFTFYRLPHVEVWTRNLLRSSWRSGAFVG